MTKQEKRIVALEAEVDALKGVVAQLVKALADQRANGVPMPTYVPPANPLPFLPGPTWEPWKQPTFAPYCGAAPCVPFAVSRLTLTQ